LISPKKLGPQGTIAKVIAERKEKSQKRLEKCKFFWRGVEITAENAALQAWRSPFERVSNCQHQAGRWRIREWGTAAAGDNKEKSSKKQRLSGAEK